MRYIFLLLCLFTTTLSAASVVSFSTSVDRASVSVGDIVTYRMSIQGGQVQDIPSFVLPDFGRYFQAVGSEESVSYRVAQGNLDAIKTRSIKLRALIAGQYEIPAAQLRVGKEVFKSQPVKISIAAASGQKNKDASQNGAATVGIKANVSKSTLYVGEQVLLEVQLYRQISFFGNPQFEPIQLSGALVEPLSVQDKTTETKVNGTRFYTNQIQRLLVAPLSPGKLTIPAAKLGFHTSPFDHLQTVNSEPVVLHVRPLPEPPEGVKPSGIVGEFSWQIQMEETQAQQLSPLVVSFVISGQGNLKPLADLQVVENKSVRIYRSKTEDTLRLSETNAPEQERRFEYIVVPQVSGHLVLPTFSWTYFSPKTGAYVTLQSPPMSLQVKAASGNVIPRPTGVVTPQEVKQDIRYLKPMPPKMMTPRIQMALWLLVLFLLVLALGMHGWRYLTGRDPQAEKRHRAYSSAMKALNQLRGQSADKGLSRAQVVVLEFLGNRVGMSFMGLTHPEIRSHLVRVGVDELLIVHTLDVLEKLSFALYAPSRIDAGSKIALLDEAEALLTQLRNI